MIHYFIEPICTQRVEGRGAATIHDVTISNIPKPPAPTSSQHLKALLAKQERTQKALARCNKALKSFESYLGSLNTQHLAVGDLSKIVDNFDSTGGRLDDKVSELETQLEEINEDIKIEIGKLSGPTVNQRLNIRAAIGVFADFEGEVEVALIYGVPEKMFRSMVPYCPLSCLQRYMVCRL